MHGLISGDVKRWPTSFLRTLTTRIYTVHHSTLRNRPIGIESQVSAGSDDPTALMSSLACWQSLTAT